MFGAAARPLSRSIAKGLLCGLIAGLFGSVCKVVGEKIYEPRTLGQTPPPLVLARNLAANYGSTVPPQQEGPVIWAIHYAFGGFAGAVYGVAAEFVPAVTGGYGAGFGIVLQLFTHETLVPAAGLDVPPWRQPAREHVSEFFSHILFGIGTEAVRRWLRKKMA